MATSTARLHAELTAEDQMSKVFKNASDAAKKMQDGFKRMQEDAGEFGKYFAGIGVAGVAAMTHFVNEAKNAEAAQTRMAHILRTATDASDAQIESLLRQADALEEVGVVSGDAIIAAQGTLATFDLQSESIEKLIPSFLDMVVAEKGVNATQEDMIGLANGLGKVLQGQVGALSKQGFTFDEVTEKILKNGTETQKIQALTEILGSTYDGLNKTMRETTEGQLKALEMQFGKVSQEIGKVLLPILNDLIAQIQPIIKSFTDWFTGLSPQQKEFIAQSLLIGTALAGVVGGALLLVAALNPITIAVAAVVGGFIWLSSELYKAGISWEEFGLMVKLAWAEFVYNTTVGVDRVLWEMKRMTLATDAELKAYAKELDDNRADEWAAYANSYNDLYKLQQEKFVKERELAEDNIARQRDLVDSSNDELKETNRKKLEEMKTEAINKFGELRLGSTEELGKMRKAAADELDKLNQEAAAKLKENVGAAFTWGQHLMENMSKGIWAKIPVLSSAINAAKSIMNEIHQSYNPELPAQLWGEHFLENFAAGMKNSAPKVFEKTEEMKQALKAQFGDDGAITEMMKKWAKDKTIAEQFEKIAEEVRQNSERLNQEFNAQFKSYQDLNVRVGGALEDLKQKHQESLDAINKKIQETKAQIDDLNKNYQINVQREDSGLGAEVVKQQDLIADLAKQLADKKSEFEKALSAPNQTSDKLAETNAKYQAEIKLAEERYAKELLALNTFMATATGLEDEIAEARRRASLTDFERFVEDTNARKSALEEEYKRKLELLQQEEQALQAQREKENVIYQQKMQQFAQVQKSFREMENVFTSGLSKMQKEAQEKVTSINSLLAQMKSALDRMGVLSGGGEQAAPITSATIPKKFATGGIVDAPTLAMIGEGGYNEAVVPLPDGRRIPVQMSGDGGGKQVTVNMNFGDIQIAKEVDAENFFAKMEDRLTRAIQLQKLGSIA